MEELYQILSWTWVAVTFSFGLCLLLLQMPDAPTLTTYRRTRKIMAIAYWLLAVMTVVELLTRTDDSADIQLTWLITLAVAAAQSFLFSVSLIVLINPIFSTRKRTLLEMAPVVAFTILCAVALVVGQRRFFPVVFYLFTAYYVSMLLRYTLFFVRNYKQYVRRVDNFYSENESAYLHWVQLLFVLALLVGIGALALVLTSNTLWYNIFTIGSIVFYAWFGIEFINYAFRFGEIKHVIKEEIHKIDNKLQQNLTDRIKEWEATKKYTRQGITIKQMAADVRTNRAYLSQQINTCYGCTFKEWINRLRIEEAKRLLLAQPELSAYEIGNLTGYADKSHFSRNFVKYEGVTPIKFRKQKEISSTHG
jgi:AraC-like DNA-binding protein